MTAETDGSGSEPGQGPRAVRPVRGPRPGSGVVVLVDATRHRRRDEQQRPGRAAGAARPPRRCSCSSSSVLYAVDVVPRRRRARQEAGEDVDLDHPRRLEDGRPARRRLPRSTRVLIEPARLGDQRRAALLPGSAFALGNRHHVRGLAIGIALSLITFYGFAIGLGVNLPAGILQGIL